MSQALLHLLQPAGDCRAIVQRSSGPGFRCWSGQDGGGFSVFLRLEVHPVLPERLPIDICAASTAARRPIVVVCRTFMRAKCQRSSGVLLNLAASLIHEHCLIAGACIPASDAVISLQACLDFRDRNNDKSASRVDSRNFGRGLLLSAVKR